MSNTKAPSEKKLSNITIILIVQLIVMALLVILITKVVSSLSRQNALDNMATITDERAKIIDNFVDESEMTLSKFCRAKQVTDLLELDPAELKLLANKDTRRSASPEAQEIWKNAQAFTVDFGQDIANLEGMWIGTWDTLVMTHTNEPVVGMTTRKEQASLQALRDSLTAAGDGVYDTGIIISPASGQQILSMYKAVYYNGKPVGLVGLGIFTEGLVDTLNNLTIRGIENSSYYMINTADNKFIFNNDPALVAQVVEDPEILKITQGLADGSLEYTGSFEFMENGVRQNATYSYMSDHGWVLLLNAPKTEVYALTNRMRVFVAIFGIMILGLAAIFGVVNARQEAINRKLNKQIVKNEKTKESLSTAMFKDILTDASNRVSLSMDLDKVKTSKDRPCYFAMFNIADFSAINTTFGNDAGDTVLVNTAQALANVFQGGTVYRTGSDEFVVAIQKEEDSTASYNQVYRQINEAHGELIKPQETPNGVVNVAYKVALVKKSSDLSTAVITVLKDMTNRSGKTPFGQVQFVDLDQQM